MLTLLSPANRQDQVPSDGLRRLLTSLWFPRLLCPFRRDLVPPTVVSTYLLIPCRSIFSGRNPTSRSSRTGGRGHTDYPHTTTFPLVPSPPPHSSDTSS